MHVRWLLGRLRKCVNAKSFLKDIAVCRRHKRQEIVDSGKRYNQFRQQIVEVRGHLEFTALRSQAPYRHFRGIQRTVELQTRLFQWLIQK